MPRAGVYGRTFARLAAAVLISALAACAGPAQKRGEVLRAGISPDHPPVAFKAEGRLTGLEVDLASLLEATLERDVELVELPRERLVPALQAGEIDVVLTGLPTTPVNRQRVDFVLPYMHVAQMALIRRDDVARLGHPRALFDVPARVGVVGGSTGEHFALTRLRRSEVAAFPDVETAVQALYSGGIDALVHDAPTVWRIAGEDREGRVLGLFWPLTEDAVAWAVRPGDTELRDSLSGAVRQWRESGALDAVISLWIPVRLQVR